MYVANVYNIIRKLGIIGKLGIIHNNKENAFEQHELT